MIIDGHQSLKLNPMADGDFGPGAKLQTHLHPAVEMRRHVTPTLLVLYGIVASALFWGGLAIPHGVGAGPELAMFHAYLVLMGVAMAFGAAVAQMLIGMRNWRGLDYVAGVLNLTVLSAAVVFVISAL